MCKWHARIQRKRDRGEDIKGEDKSVYVCVAIQRFALNGSLRIGEDGPYSTLTQRLLIFYFISLSRVLSRVQLYFNYSQYYGWRKPVSSRGKPTNIRGLVADFGIWNCNTRVCRRMVIIEV